MDKSKWLWLAHKCGVASKEFPQLIEKLGDIEKIYAADYEQYIGAGISERLAEDLSDKSMTAIMPIINYCRNARIGVICYDDEIYPMSLRALKDPPAVLYYKGKLPNLNRRLCISMVGTRKMSEYGMRAAYKIAYEVASSGAVVVSGMALGIDGIASAAAIAAGGETVAVLGCGIDRVYPSEHINLCELIKRNGAVLTEFAPGTQPKGNNFPIRNRIISGLSQGTVVVDADKSSGAMITAKTAILQGKDIYAVPGNIDSETASGTNMLIRDGAQAVLSGSDIIFNYAYLYKDSIDMQRLHMSEFRSEINLDIVKRMGVATRVIDSPHKQESSTPQKLGITAGRRAPRPTKEESAANKKSEVPVSNTDKREDLADHGANFGGNISVPISAGDNSAKIVDSLSEKQRKIFDEIPIDKAITVDYLTAAGFSMGEVMSTLTILEIKGLISSLPGALYVRK